MVLPPKDDCRAMKITDYLCKQNIFLDVKLPDKSAVLEFIAQAAVKNGIVGDAVSLHQGLVQRESTMSTGVGCGFGFPHTTTPEAEDAAVILIRLAEPIEFDSIDNEPVDIVLGLIIPETNRDIHVRLLARVSRLCQNPEFLSAVKRSDNPETVCRVLADVENTSLFTLNSKTAG